MPWLGAQGLSADPAAQRRQPQKSHLSFSFSWLLLCFSTFIIMYKDRPSISALLWLRSSGVVPVPPLLQVPGRGRMLQYFGWTWQSPSTFETDVSLSLIICILTWRGRTEALNSDGEKRESRGTEGVTPAQPFFMEQLLPGPTQKLIKRLPVTSP